MEPESPLGRPCRAMSRTLIRNGGRYDNIFWTEKFNEGMQSVLDRIETSHPVDLAPVPALQRERRARPKRAHPVEAYFDDLSMLSRLR